MAALGVAIFGLGAGIVAIPAFAAQEHCLFMETGSGCVAVTPQGWDVSYEGHAADRPEPGGDDAPHTLFDTIFFHKASNAESRVTRVFDDHRHIRNGDQPRHFSEFREDTNLPVTHIKLQLCNRVRDFPPNCIESDLIKV